LMIVETTRKQLTKIPLSTQTRYMLICDNVCKRNQATWLEESMCHKMPIATISKMINILNFCCYPWVKVIYLCWGQLPYDLPFKQKYSLILLLYTSTIIKTICWYMLNFLTKEVYRTSFYSFTPNSTTDISLQCSHLISFCL
jgi:hypothetical protein